MSEKTEHLWNRVLTESLNVPGVAVNREAFLRNELKPFLKEAELDEFINRKKELPSELRNRIANGCIKYHTTLACSVAAGLGLPKGWWIVGTIPADLAQFYAQVLILLQKMLYLYGWEDLRDKQGNLTGEATQIVTLWIGVMLGCGTAITAIKEVLQKVAVQAGKRIPKMAFGHNATYVMAKQVAKWIGVKLTKETIGKAAAKIIPHLGAPINASLTYYTFRPMANRLKKYLDENCAMA